LPENKTSKLFFSSLARGAPLAPGPVFVIEIGFVIAIVIAIVIGITCMHLLRF
jgi:hypothetical protein